MPELAEVQRAAQILKAVALHRKIKNVTFFPDTIVHLAPLPSYKALTGAVVNDVGRYGKHFYAITENKQNDVKDATLVMHLGMAGFIKVKGEAAVTYRKDMRQGEDVWPPKYCKLILKFDNEQEFAYCDPRRLGRVRIVDTADPRSVEPLSELGYDPIVNWMTVEEWDAILIKTIKPIKAVLLDQGVCAGIGNWLADEILFHARVHPAHPSCTLTKEEQKRLYDAVLYVCKIAVEVNADHHKSPEHWLFMHRWGKGKVVKTKKVRKEIIEPVASLAVNEIRLLDGTVTTLKWETIAGRTTAFAPSLQIAQAALNRTKVKAEEVGLEVKSEADTSKAEVDTELTEFTPDVDTKPHKSKKTVKTEVIKTTRSRGQAKKSIEVPEAANESDLSDAPASPPIKKIRKSRRIA